MTRTKLLLITMGVAMLALFAAPASAQDGPTITVEPATVDAPGEQEFTVTGAGWTAAPPIFILPCEAPASGDAADIDSATCDTTNLTPATPVDGAFEVTVTFEVAEGGLAIAAADAAQNEAAAAVITVGAAEGGEGTDDGAADDGATDDGATDDGATDEGATDEGGDEDLADTGVESGLLAIIGVAVLGAGAMAVGYTRRFS